MGAGGCLARGVSSIFINVCSSIYLLIGLIVIVAGFVSFLTPQGKAIITTLYAGGALATGFFILVVGILGFASQCSKKWYKAFLTAYMLFTVALITACGILGAFAFNFEDSMSLAEGITGASQPSATVLKNVGPMVRRTVNACEGAASRTRTMDDANPDELNFRYECTNRDFSFLGKAIDTCFKAGPVDISGSAYANELDSTFPRWAPTGSPFFVCYHGKDSESSRAWPMPVYELDDANTVLAVSTPKGIFCQCSGALMDELRPYLQYMKWIYVGVVVFLLIVVVVCCYLLCCDKSGRWVKGKKGTTGPKK